jgi:hypothetical protein
MGFSSAKRALLPALATGNVQHEARAVLAEKNLLAVGDVSLDEVAAIVRRSRGGDYSTAPHHWDADTEVHVFRPTVQGTRWYVKVYFLEEPEGTAVFISVHRQER